jgi:Cys-tRNA(Pro) deacylase
VTKGNRLSEQKKLGSRERVREFLAARGLDDGLFEFEQSTKTAAMAAEAMGCELGQIVKSLVVVVDGERAVLALVAGDRRGDLDAIATQFEGLTAKMANADVVRSATGYAIGGVSPFDLPAGLPILIDDSLARFETVFPAAGTPSSMVRMQLEQLVDLTGGRMARISH